MEVLDASTSPTDEPYSVSKDNIIQLIQPGNIDDQFTEILRNGARCLLAQAVEAEVADFLGMYTNLKTEDGRQRVVRHGHLRDREVMTGIGPVSVRQPRMRDREANAADPERIRFSPSILPPYMRRSKSIQTLLPILCVGGAAWQGCCRVVGIGHRPPEGRLVRRTLCLAEARSIGERYVYIWADGIHIEARLEDESSASW